MTYACCPRGLGGPNAVVRDLLVSQIERRQTREVWRRGEVSDTGQRNRRIGRGAANVDRGKFQNPQIREVFRLPDSASIPSGHSRAISPLLP